MQQRRGRRRPSPRRHGRNNVRAAAGDLECVFISMFTTGRCCVMLGDHRSTPSPTIPSVEDEPAFLPSKSIGDHRSTRSIRMGTIGRPINGDHRSTHCLPSVLDGGDHGSTRPPMGTMGRPIFPRGPSVNTGSIPNVPEIVTSSTTFGREGGGDPPIPSLSPVLFLGVLALSQCEDHRSTPFGDHRSTRILNLIG